MEFSIQYTNKTFEYLYFGLTLNLNDIFIGIHFNRIIKYFPKKKKNLTASIFDTSIINTVKVYMIFCEIYFPTQGTVIQFDSRIYEVFNGRDKISP